MEKHHNKVGGFFSTLELGQAYLIKVRSIINKS